MRRFTAHPRFFSSLKQMEDRLETEAQDEPEPPTLNHPPSPSPIFLDFACPDGKQTSQPPPPDSSDPPLNFLSSLSCPQDEDPKSQPGEDGEESDEIEQLMSLLCLREGQESTGGGESSCHCSGGGFFSKIGGVKEPKCGKERERLYGWIEYYYKEKKESARLAHLLLAKAWCLNRSGRDSLVEIEFPSTIVEFLEQDPPTMKDLWFR
ncbi:uncharacterized protein LOC122051636 [Zingiber officinale]|uniref:Uncharacterized protein n=1 Tax=Zingiber officinale TaxID=94328 RepID=A0A8J5HM98_ZINOF|nr:uncharacterized protein LOC122051636 [Zingiber officinale]KAG6531498.1 hypothetical protein ZIOFF_005312 [Zingiber officinale]